jgi:hypothetical protein
MWFATIVAGMVARADVPGVTSIVRALNRRPELYYALLRLFHSSAVKLDRLTALWVHTVLLLFPSPVRVNGPLVPVGDGVKIPKRGKKVPGVKLLHQLGIQRRPVALIRDEAEAKSAVGAQKWRRFRKRVINPMRPSQPNLLNANTVRPSATATTMLGPVLLLCRPLGERRARLVR